jgi:hypothetical protein
MLADALARLASNADLRRAMGRAARHRLLGGYTEAHVKHSVREAYRSLLGNVHVPEERIWRWASGLRTRQA